MNKLKLVFTNSYSKSAMLLLKKEEGKLLYYKRLKKVYKCEKYLNILNLDHRRAVTSIRVSDHIFPIEIGWKNKY